MTIFILISLLIGILACYLLVRNISNTPLKLFIPCALITLTALIYQTLGTPKALTKVQTNKPTKPVSNNLITPEKLQLAINKLESITQENPQDIEKLILLANSYSLTKRHLDAARVWERISSLDSNPEYNVRQANTLIAANQGVIPQNAADNVQLALSKNAEYPEALWLAGLFAAQNGDNKIATQHWQRLLPLVPANKKDELSQLLSQLNEPTSANISNETIVKKTTEAAPTQQSNVAQATVNNEISIDLSISQSLLSAVSPSNTVFVFAKALNGSPAPLAVKKLTVADLPTTVKLSDTDAMIAGMTISKFKEVTISAKISTSNNAANKTGDIGEHSIVVQSSAQNKTYLLELK